MKEMNYVYLVRCADGSLYCGWTTDLPARMEAHNSGKGAKYTRSRLPVQLVWYETCEDRHEAQSREWHIKRMSRDEKMALVNGGDLQSIHTEGYEKRRISGCPERYGIRPGSDL